MKSSVLVTGETLSYEYPGEIAALHDVSINISSGDRLALVGQNGSGKTTLAKLLAGLLKPKSGQVRLEDEWLQSIPPKRRSQSIGFVFQNPDHQIFSSSVREEIAFGPANLGLVGDDLENRIEEELARFDLEPIADFPPASLSFGLRRKISIASILAMRTPIVILDEPSLGLDWRSASSLMDILISASDGPESIVFITHDLRLVARYAEEIALLQHGHLIQRGSTHQILQDEQMLNEVGLKPPPMALLAAKFAADGMPPEVLEPQSFSQKFLQLLAQNS